MNKFLAVVGYTIKENIRRRVFLTVILFGVILVGGSVIVAPLAVDERGRLMVNLGLAGIEFIALLSIVFVTVNLILEEMESKSIYLILSRPIERWQYVLGRYIGTFSSIAVGMAFMALLHVGSLMLHGWDWQNFYLIAWICAVGKIAVISSLALFISLVSTSTASAMTLTAFLWIMGHFSSELKFLGEKSANPFVKVAVGAFYYITPDFNAFNYRDFYRIALPPSEVWLGWLAFYTLCYCGMMLFLSSWLFSKREF